MVVCGLRNVAHLQRVYPDLVHADFIAVGFLRAAMGTFASFKLTAPNRKTPCPVIVQGYGITMMISPEQRQ